LKPAHRLSAALALYLLLRFGDLWRSRFSRAAAALATKYFAQGCDRAHWA
jgi:hypothetical protein